MVRRLNTTSTNFVDPAIRLRKKFTEIAQDLGFWTKKNTYVLPLFYIFGVIFQFCGGFWPILFAQNFQTKILVAQKKYAFRKSGLG